MANNRYLDTHTHTDTRAQREIPLPVVEQLLCCPDKHIYPTSCLATAQATSRTVGFSTAQLFDIGSSPPIKCSLYRVLTDLCRESGMIAASDRRIWPFVPIRLLCSRLSRLLLRQPACQPPACQPTLGYDITPYVDRNLRVHWSSRQPYFHICKYKYTHTQSHKAR